MLAVCAWAPRWVSVTEIRIVGIAVRIDRDRRVIAAAFAKRDPNLALWRLTTSSRTALNAFNWFCWAGVAFGDDVTWYSRLSTKLIEHRWRCFPGLLNVGMHLQRLIEFADGGRSLCITMISRSLLFRAPRRCARGIGVRNHPDTSG